MLFGCGLPSFAQRNASTSIETSGREMITPATQQAIERGLAVLAAKQHRDGSFGSESRYKRNVAVASLAGMAFLSAGHAPGRGRYSQTVEQTVEFILDSAQSSGYIIQPDSAGHGPMYGHGFATLFLAEVYGMSPKQEVRSALKGAVQLIVNSQNPEGGWRYEPDGREADISVTVCQIMALRAARNCGIAVPKSTVDQSLDYVRRCRNTDGGYAYQLELRRQSEFARSAAALVGLTSAGVYEGKDFEDGLRYLELHRPLGDLHRFESHYYYGHYYAVQAMWHAGGEHWKNWYPAIRDELVSKQMSDGAWTDHMINNEYGTAMALLILQMPNNYLPIFQR
jgi:prenyltransferase beta subunit